VSLVIHCLGVDKNSKTLLIPLEMSKSQAVIDNYPVDKPPALMNPDGTPLHQPINNPSNTSDSISVINIYAITSKDGEDIVAFKESANSLKVLDIETKEKMVADFAKLFYAPKLNAQEVIDDAEDIDLGIPPKDRSLTDEQKQKRIQDEILLVKNFHAEIRSFIYDASPEELKNMRTNFTIAIATFAELEDSLKANPDIDQQYFKTIIEYTIQTRMLVIDAMIARGIQQ
jgi:hypothetical protein